MFRLPVKTLHAAAVAIPALLATTAAIPANAQISVSIGFDDFHSRLAPYGTWSNNPRWGEVWHPTRVNRDFRPYSDGYWANTREYGVVWVSNESWGDIPYHYGRWISDPREGWLWVPGYVWGPSWVVWRSGGGNIGWFPMPPGDNYYGDGAYRDNFDSEYGYRDWYGPSFGSDQFLSLWIFVGQDHFADRDYRNYAIPQRDYGRFVSQTTNTTNYATINNYVVNRSIDQNRLPRGTSQLLQPVPASSVFGRNAEVTQAGAGRQVEQRERQQHPIPVSINPAEQSGRGNQNSSAQQPNPVQGPQGPALDTSRQNGRGLANINPAEQRGRANQNSGAQQQNPVQAPQGPALDTSRQNGRGLANINPAEQRGRANQNSGAQQQNPVQGPQGPALDTSRRGLANINPAEQRDHANTNLPQPNVNQGSQDLRSGGGNRGFNSNGAVQSNLQTGRPANPAVNNGGQANPQIDRGNRSFQAPQTGGAPDTNGKVIVQNLRAAPRAQVNPPAAAIVNQQGNARDNQARGNKQGDAKNAGEQNSADHKKN